MQLQYLPGLPFVSGLNKRGENDSKLIMQSGSSQLSRLIGWKSSTEPDVLSMTGNTPASICFPVSGPGALLSGCPIQKESDLSVDTYKNSLTGSRHTVQVTKPGNWRRTDGLYGNRAPFFRCRYYADIAYLYQPGKSAWPGMYCKCIWQLMH